MDLYDLAQFVLMLVGYSLAAAVAIVICLYAIVPFLWLIRRLSSFVSKKPKSIDLSVHQAAEKIRVAINLGAANSSLDSSERIMVAFATCDRVMWLPGSSATAAELWKLLNDQQRDAIAFHLNGN